MTDEDQEPQGSSLSTHYSSLVFGVDYAYR